KIDIISNPGAKYEAEGNAGIIDIRLKKSDNQGYSGNVSATYGQGFHGRGNTNASVNYRNKTMNVFGSAGYYKNTFSNEMYFDSWQNGLFLKENMHSLFNNEGYSTRLGADFFLHKNH